MPVSLPDLPTLLPARTLVTDSWVPYRLPSPVTHQSVVALVLPLALEDPKVLHRPDFDGFIRRSSSIISSLVISFILSFPSPTPSAHPRTCHQSLHLIITPAPSLHHPSPLYTQPVNASSCHLFPLALQTPHQNSITSIAMILSCSLTHIRYPAHRHRHSLFIQCTAFYATVRRES